MLGNQVELLLAVEDGNGVDESLVQQLHDVVDVNLTLESVADDVVLLVEKPLLVQRLDQIDVECGGSLDVHVVLQHLRHHKLEMVALGAVTIVVTSFVIGLCDGHVEPSLRLLDVGGDFRQIGDFQWRAVLFDDVHQRHFVEYQVVVFHAELFLREIIRLRNQVDVLGLHPSEFFEIKTRQKYIKKQYGFSIKTESV